MTTLHSNRSVAHMLAADPDTPKPKPTVYKESRSMPTPVTWKGMREGLYACKLLYHQGELEQAESVLQELLELSPSEAKIWAWLGKIQEKSGNINTSQQSYKKACLIVQQQRATSFDKPASLQLARLLWKQGAGSDACAMLDELLLGQNSDHAEIQALQQQWEDGLRQC